jgi:Ca2+-transporting ATPase
LTGESMPISKNDELLLKPDAELIERKNMVFAGSTITRGKGKAVVVATSMDTELGHIAGLTKSVKEPKTPLQIAMKQLVKWLVLVALFFSILIPLIGILQGRDPIEMILTGLSLSFATIPEELPIIIMIVLALGSMTLSRRNALVKYLNAAETLGSVTVIATDKTGTITENKMKVTKIFTNDQIADFNSMTPTPTSHRLIEIGVLVNDVIVKKIDSQISYLGDPMEIALIDAGKQFNISFEEFSKQYQLKEEYSFDNKRMMMSQIYLRDNNYFVFVKGASEEILNKSIKYLTDNEVKSLNEDQKKLILAKVNEMAGEGLRILSFAYKEIPNIEISQEQAEGNLIFVGLIGFIDPPREEVKEAIKLCKTAGVRVIMITGDYEITAKNIAKTVGIASDKTITGRELENMTDEKLKEVVKNVSVFARTTPEHKLRIISALKENGEIIAVTGDGINDAPALKKADIGIAMGLSGTDVAKETADMVLLDDNFATITESVKQGRKLFDNLKKGVKYYLAVKMALIIIFMLPALFYIPLPFAPIQIILLELFMDLAASSAFVVELSEGDTMKRKPRDPTEKFMNFQMTKGILMGATSLCIAVLSTYLIAINLGLSEARTVAFATWMISHIFLAINMRTERDSLRKIGFFTNKVMLLWGFAVIIVLFSIIYIPSLQMVFRVTPLTLMDWILIFGISFIATFWIEFKKFIQAKKSKS